MRTWSDELSEIAASEELELASARRDGTLRRPVTIWVVRHATTSTSGLPMDAGPPGSAARRTATKVTSRQAGLIRTSLRRSRRRQRRDRHRLPPLRLQVRHSVID